MDFPRAEMEEMWSRWTAANEAAEAADDWIGLGAFYTVDAFYTWKVGHHGEFAARGRQDRFKARQQRYIDGTAPGSRFV